MKRTGIWIVAAMIALTLFAGLSMAKRYSLDADPGHFQITGHAAVLTYSTIRTVIKKNWALIGLYAAITIGSWVASYFTNKWWSVGLSVGVSLVTFWAGWYMIQQVVTITNKVK